MTALVETKYQGNDAQVYRIKMNANFAAAAGTAPTEDVTTDIKPKITKANREHGIRPRGVRLVRTVGTPPDTFKKYAFLVVLTNADWASSTYAPGATVAINSIDYTVSSRVGEDY